MKRDTEQKEITLYMEMEAKTESRMLKYDDNGKHINAFCTINILTKLLHRVHHIFE